MDLSDPDVLLKELTLLIHRHRAMMRLLEALIKDFDQGNPIERHVIYAKAWFRDV